MSSETRKWREQPHNFSREEVLNAITGKGNFRNPTRIPNVKGTWPKPQDERARDYEKMFHTQEGGMARKGRPI